MNNTASVKTKETPEISFAWNVFDNMMSKKYLDFLPQMAIIANDQSFSDSLKNVRIDKITKIVYDKVEDNLTKLNNVFSAVYSAGTAVFIFLKNSETITDIYIGVRGNCSQDATDSMKVLEHALSGNFPGIMRDEMDSDDVGELSDYIRDEKNPCVAAVTGVPSLKEDDPKKFAQGLEKIIDAMGTQNYAALLLAEPISRESLERIEEAYQNLYSDISLLNISSLTLTEQESTALGKSLARGFSDSIAKSIANTQTTSHTETNTQSTSHSVSDGTSYSTTRSYAGLAGTAGAGIGAAVGSVIPGVGTLVGGAVGGAIGGIVGGLIGSHTSGTTHTETDTSTDSVSIANGESSATSTTDTQTHTETETSTDTNTQTVSSGKNFQYEVKNKHIVESLKLLDEQLERVRIAKNYGAWSWAAYVIAPNTSTAKIGADIFTGILKGEKSGIERNSISYWNHQHPQYKKLIDSLSKFQHPHFALDTTIMATATSVLSTPELTVGMSLPQKSLPGIPVFETAEFGRSISWTGIASRHNSIDIGAISHMGYVDTKNKVSLDLKSLTSHTFVTGSTGSGKSNAIYMILDWLHNKASEIPFLIIEPAKGEYKNIFGGHRRVSVYGTNPFHTPLLRINPFAFPSEIHVMEHIDRLIEILNAVWPMYAAMPAILKEAVERTYKKCGWDLLLSKNRFQPCVYPDFQDLLACLPDVIQSSKYAEEVKSNYSGALLTRVRSLTNGYYKTILQKEEISPEDLFDRSCIIDISRIGSSETKSLLMGIVFLKLQEYRMAKATASNAELKHITVIEEAHNLLRRTSTEQGVESANLQGKSVEMISNAIAEMRTYGEGFIIADQAPGLLDPSVIRNTNTKIVLRLPDYNDRVLVGKAQNLNDVQIEELARLTTGCACVYQNNWQEAVLCQFNRFNDKDAIPFVKQKYQMSPDSRTRAEHIFLSMLLKGLSEANDVNCLYKNLSEAEKILLQMYYPDYNISLLSGKIQESDQLWFLNELLVKNAIDENPLSDDIRVWTQTLLQTIFSDERVSDFEPWLKDVLLSATFKILAIYDKNPEQKKIWLNEESNTMKWRNW